MAGMIEASATKSPSTPDLPAASDDSTDRAWVGFA
jgi:hypothetical protein